MHFLTSSHALVGNEESGRKSAGMEQELLELTIARFAKYWGIGALLLS